MPRLFNFVNLFFTAVITTRHELLEDFYAKVSPALIQRFKEREENVKADIFHAYVALLKQTKTAILPQLALQGILILIIIDNSFNLIHFKNIDPLLLPTYIW